MYNYMYIYIPLGFVLVQHLKKGQHKVMTITIIAIINGTMYSHFSLPFDAGSCAGTLVDSPLAELLPSAAA